ncbi:MAG: hypothetical protein V4591_01640, partial [Bdellovibrionota bacterium]
MTQNFKTLFISTCNSTMDEAKKQSQEIKNDHIFCIVAQKQTRGRGRGGSTWHQAFAHTEENSLNASTDHKNIQHFPTLQDALKNETDFLPITFFIPALKLKIPIEWLSIVVGCALYDALKQTCTFIENTISIPPKMIKKEDFFLKWPNDIITLPGCKKISGILCETSVLNGTVNDIFVGIGLNFFNNPSFENSISFFDSQFSFTLTTDLKKSILSYFTNIFCQEIEEYLLHARSVEQLKHLALSRMTPKGTLLSVNKGATKGKFLDLALNGALILEGTTEPIYSGDVSIETSQIQNNSYVIPKNDKKFKPIIAIDFGNTRIHLANRNSYGIIEYIDIKYDVNFDHSATLKSELKSILENLLEDKLDTVDIFYSSVNTKEKTDSAILFLI